MMRRAILHNYAFGVPFVKMLVADIAEDQMCRQPGGLKNHPAWTLGHMALATGFTGTLLGLESKVPAEWNELCGRGSTPTDDRAKYPGKEEMLSALETEHARVVDAFQKVDPGMLAQRTPDEELGELMPTLGDALVFMMSVHQAIHVGQLVAWRQLMGLPRVFS